MNDERTLDERIIEEKVKRFNEQYDKLVAETGMIHVAVLHYDQLMGIRPALAVVRKKDIEPTKP